MLTIATLTPVHLFTITLNFVTIMGCVAAIAVMIGDIRRDRRRSRNR